MKAFAVDTPGPIETHPLLLTERPDPDPGEHEVRVKISVCGLCRTDLHLAEGDLPPRSPLITPGHEIVGIVDGLGANATRFAVGDRIGIAWLRGTCGECRYCLRGDENLCLSPSFTGWDANGGFAEFATVNEAFAYRIPDQFDDQTAAPLLCAGIIGYRALDRACLPDGGRLGIYGFGGSAHLTAQIALHRGARVHVMTRAAEARELAIELGAASAQDAYDSPPEKLDSAIVFAPVGDLVPAALEALDRGGTLACAGIYMTDIPRIDYSRQLFNERNLRSVTANTRKDGEAFLAVAAEIPISVATVGYAFGETNSALKDLAADRFAGAAVIEINP